MLNPLAPPFMLYPLQLYRPPTDTTHPHRHHHHPSVVAYPFPQVPAPPADFASPIPIGGMVAVQCFGGYTPDGHAQTTTGGVGGGSSANPAMGGICWDPVVGMYRATTSAPGQVYEQEQNGGSNTS